ncbi:MAG: hypothetical protein ACK5QT_06680 [Oligoflexia bacterium]|jgi:hypothetical protein
MKALNRFNSLATLIALSALASGCGGEAYRETTPVPKPSPSPSTGTGWGGGGTGGGSGGTGTGGGNSNLLPAFSTTFSITGRGGAASGTNTQVSPYIFTASAQQTDNQLKVKVTAQAGDPIGNGSNFTANYTCVKYVIKVMNTERETGWLRVGTGGFPVNGPCNPNTPTSEVIDFSDLLQSGSNSVNVQVTGVRYDFYCTMLNSYMMPYAPWDPWAVQNYCLNGHPVYYTHVVKGRLQIQVNGTTF